MLLFDKNLDINKNLKKTIDSVSKNRIIIRYGDVYISIEDPKLLLEVTKYDFKYNAETNTYDLTLSRFNDMNVMNVVNTYSIFFSNNEGFKFDNIKLKSYNNGYNTKLYSDIETNNSKVVYKIPILIADILNILQEFSISKRW